jgi:hypothetical protein
VLKLLKQNIFIMKLACELLALGALARGRVDDLRKPALDLSDGVGRVCIFRASCMQVRIGDTVDRMLGRAERSSPNAA